MSKREDWNKNPELSAWLNGVLTSPQGRFFMEVMEEESELRLNINMPPQFLTAHGAAMSGRVLAYERALCNIRELAHQRDPVTPPPIETYGVIKAEDATE